ncbi:MAG: 30S ribosomal protein S4 [Nitrospinae bacterium]|nr:30S ribosomal protein S4 [Nitrospinota bacterium]MBF0634314.1 30S ribosomal protein S4 [Nitrospinota bacterium]
MARYVGPSCRLCRREGMKLFLKGERCVSNKCAFERRGFPPGMAGQGRPKVKEYGLQLREKQKVKRVYGVLERQFRGYFAKADKAKGVTGENLLIMLETRLDTVVTRLGFATSVPQARQLIRHNHFLINGHKMDIPSYRARKGDVIEVREASRGLASIKSSLDRVTGKEQAGWLALDKEAMKGTVTDLPARDAVTLAVQEQLIVELYSK